MTQIDHSRRAFFKRPSSLKSAAQVSDTAIEEANTVGLLPQRPPWALNEFLFVDQCTRCNECITACEEEIIIRADGGFPEIDFNRGECTFCELCFFLKAIGSMICSCAWVHSQIHNASEFKGGEKINCRWRH